MSGIEKNDLTGRETSRGVVSADERRYSDDGRDWRIEKVTRGKMGNHVFIFYGAVVEKSETMIRSVTRL